ncbi:cytokinin riboside 5'-monophosphate phosphoribohydrolase [Lentzea sp. NBRC 105346]|uniref:LOG family protein n=1 Tax=Lentzea sp. NBRC 105346 TaxID=3032205 RepID=UPI0024A32577|nr:TIGR00730 family Rossman fold protein [Lentzea sp. NBRC 105346]GLZ35744.1 cytokinin riboside 5'-monophosphate phosphoribohydrolase [Lentzea sp. NBRC 105346]
MHVCVYCGSLKTVPQSYLDLAASVGTQIAARGWSLVWGGGRTSMMGAVSSAARAGGSRTIGVIPRGLATREIADHDADELLVVDTMRERKAAMEAHADAFLALPGGIGTAEEFFEVWTSRVLAMHAKPVVLLDVDNHYKGLVEWLYQLRDKGFVSEHALRSLVVTDDVSAALDACVA